MGNKICVDKKPSKIDNLITFNPQVLDSQFLENLKKYLSDTESSNHSYQHLSIWSLSENIEKPAIKENGLNQNQQSEIINNKDKDQNNNKQQENSASNNIQNKELNNSCDNEPKVVVTPVEISKIHKNHFLLDSHNIYVLLLIFKKDCETIVENSPFPTGLWGIIESSSNMTPRGLLFAFPTTHNCQNLESFLLSKREFNDSEFKYMLFIWNGKKSTAFLRSVSLMKAFDLDKALMNTTLVHCIYYGYYFNDNISSCVPERIGCIQLGEVINNTIESSEDTSTPSSDKINNLHETVYLFKLLYPNTKHKNKGKHSKRNKKIADEKQNNNENTVQNGNQAKKGENILFRGFNNYFLASGPNKKFYDSFTEIDVGVTNNINNNKINCIDDISISNLSNNFRNNTNLEKSNLSNSNIKSNKNIVMPPKLNLNLNISGNKIINYNNPAEDNLNSKSSVSVSTSREDNKKEELNGINNNNKKLNELNLNNININNGLQSNIENDKENNKENISKNIQENNKDNNKDDFEEDEDDPDLISAPLFNNNISSSISNSKKMVVPKLMVSFQRNTLSEEKMTERAKIKSEQEENLNVLPESTLISTSQHIINNSNRNNIGINKLNLISANSLNLNNLEKNKSINNANNNQEKVENSDSINIQLLNEDFSLKDSERKKIISDYYSKRLSEIIPDFLYLSSYNAAKNRDLLEQNKITHIINCAADFCENLFNQDKKFTYLSFYLKDHVIENIECLFYECIKFIENAKEKGGRVLVHCIQGISRSVTIVIAYLIFSKKISYDKAFNIVQEQREIASPNFGFSIQLQNFFMRLYEDPSKYRYIPKIFAVGTFQNEPITKIVCRLMNEPFYEHKENGLPRMLDKRGVFIIVSLTKVYLWIGSKVSPTSKDIYLESAKSYINILKQYEHAPVGEEGPELVYDGKESDEFLNDLLKTKDKINKFKKNISDIFPEWNIWYKEIKTSPGDKLVNKDKNNLNGNGEKNNSISSSSLGNEIKKGFFLYPNEKSDAVLDLDDLNDETLLIACIYQKNTPKIFLWKGKLVDINESVYNNYKNKVIKNFFQQYGLTEEQYNKIDCINEVPLEESDDFLSFI